MTSLAKGFVRSAVYQVGRDGGRVISNQIYGNAYSAPVRCVNGYALVSNNGSGADPILISDEMIEHKGIEDAQMSVGKMILFGFLACFFHILATIVFGIIGLNKMTAKTASVKINTAAGKLSFPAPPSVLDAIHASAKYYFIFAGIGAVVFIIMLLAK